MRETTRGTWLGLGAAGDSGMIMFCDMDVPGV